MISRSQDVMNFLLDDVLLASVGSNLMAALVVAAGAAVNRVIAAGGLVIDSIVSLIILIAVKYSIKLDMIQLFLSHQNENDLHSLQFNGTFEYEEYISLKSINDPNEGYETISDLMTLQDQIDTFQKLVFAHFRGVSNNECRISSLVPLVVETYGIYKFITSMLRAMHTSKPPQPN